jgi:hypothetical protein
MKVRLLRGKRNQYVNNPMTIDDTVLLQVNATVMVGIFIFLTIRGLIPDRPIDLRQSKAWLMVISILVIPFAESAMLILLDTGNGELSRLARIVTSGGFGYILLLFLAVIVILTFQRKNKGSANANTARTS